MFVWDNHRFEEKERTQVLLSVGWKVKYHGVHSQPLSLCLEQHYVGQWICCLEKVSLLVQIKQLLSRPSHPKTIFLFGVMGST